MDNIKQLFKETSKRYNKRQPHDEHARGLVAAAHRKLAEESEFVYYGDYTGNPAIRYNVFSLQGGVSRPVRPDIYISDPAEFHAKFETLIENLRRGAVTWNDDEARNANEVVYTSVLAVACCYDLWQRRSRKTPGTVFEILMAALLQTMLPQAAFSKHIPLTDLLEDMDVADAAEETVEPAPAEDGDGPGSVSTDLVVKSTVDADSGIVIPLKITTRERIVQPFAHQRILDSAFGPGAFRSLLVCISETQLDDKTKSVKQVCVPGTVKLFQKYVAPLSALYYCDVPQRYATEDMQKVISVRSVGEFFIDVAKTLNAYSASDI